MKGWDGRRARPFALALGRNYALYKHFSSFRVVAPAGEPASLGPGARNGPTRKPEALEKKLFGCPRHYYGCWYVFLGFRSDYVINLIQEMSLLDLKVEKLQKDAD
jgi:hypothetical protein